MTDTNIDPVTAEIIRDNLVAIAGEMKTNLMRTAYSLIIYEAQDFTVGLFDLAGNTITIGLGLPMFIGGLSDAVKAKIAHYGLDGFRPGDIILTNDGYIMGSHLNHLIFTLPIFFDGELVAFASSMAHWVDVGGMLGGSTQDIYSEGLQIPIVKIFKDGAQDDELTRMLAANIRLPESALGDLRAQVAAIRTGEARYTELLGRYGRAAVDASITDMYDRSERLARKAVAGIPDGVYHGEAFMDDDGVNVGRLVPVGVTVIVSGDQMTADFSAVSDQVAGYFNSGPTTGRGAAQVAFKCLTSPGLFPINEGSLRPVDVILPPGKVVSAAKPAAMRWWMTYPMTIVDAIFRALADAVPGGTIAGHHADLMFTNLYGTDPVTGEFAMFYSSPQGGGWGATAYKDGENATVCVNDGDTHNTPVEALEQKFPMMAVDSYALRTDSGGAGRFRGGLGTEVVYQVGTPMNVNSAIERTICPPWGIDGGHDALPNSISILAADGTEQTYPNGKLNNVPVQPGQGFVVRTGGGGGYGSPLDRDPGTVLQDVRSGYVSPGQARDAYRVVLVAADGDWSVDEEATATLRAADRSR